jgi:hypothetical protein
LLFISIILPGAFGDASAQSERIIPKPTLPPSTESPDQPEAKPKFVPDPDAHKYKLVFPLSSKRKIYKEPPKNRREKKEREKELERDKYNIAASYRDSFIEQLNEAGALGYRLIALGARIIGIVRLGNVQYEYTWFETFSSYEFTKGGFAKEYAPLARQGFSVVGHLFLGSICKSEPTSRDKYGAVPRFAPPYCEYRDFFLLEREKGIERRRHVELAQDVPRWRGPRSEEVLATQINDYMAFGFKPILALSRYEILFHPITGKDEFLPKDAEVKVVIGNVKKKVNELARQGYRLALTQFQIAVLYPPRGTTAPVSYIWLDSMKKKSFEQELARLQDSGAIYRMIYPNVEGVESTLIFEQPGIDVSKRYQYKVLKVDFQGTENFADQRVDFDLTPSSKEAIKMLNRLVKEGFAVRDLFASDPYAAKEVSILLERTQ